MTVEVDLFSGRPNPVWALTAGEGRELVERLRALPAAASAPAPDALGYRGVVVRGLPGDCAEARLAGGRAHLRCAGGERVAADAGRAVERWVIATARGRVDAAMLDVVHGAAGLVP